MIKFKSISIILLSLLFVGCQPKEKTSNLVKVDPEDNLEEIESPDGTYGNGSEPKPVKIPSDPELQKISRPGV